MKQNSPSDDLTLNDFDNASIEYVCVCVWCGMVGWGGYVGVSRGSGIVEVSHRALTSIH